MNILITGGASGLGRAITEKLIAENKHNIYFTYRKSGDSAREIEERAQNVRSVRCDFTDQKDITRLIEFMPEFDLDVLINNATTPYRQEHFHKIEPEFFYESFKMNVYPVLSITGKAIQIFRKKKFGKIINILTSALINRPPVGTAEYTANKTYLASMSRSWASENAQFNITSNSISPAFMETGLTGSVDERIVENMKAGHPLKRLLTTEETAEAVLFLVNATQQINGVNLPINAAADFA